MDIKSENFIINQYFWVKLTDFSPFKPKILPIHDPSIFNFYFDSSRRRACNIAPERFVENIKHTKNPKLGQRKRSDTITSREDSSRETNTYSESDTGNSEGLYNSDHISEKDLNMSDIFSLGCCIYEFLTSKSLFNLSDVINYKESREFIHQEKLELISNQHLKDMISSMTSLNPNSRMKASGYLQKYRETLFPIIFYDELYPIFTEKLIFENSSGGSSNATNSDTETELENILSYIYENLEKVGDGDIFEILINYIIFNSNLDSIKKLNLLYQIIEKYSPSQYIYIEKIIPILIYYLDDFNAGNKGGLNINADPEINDQVSTCHYIVISLINATLNKIQPINKITKRSGEKKEIIAQLLLPCILNLISQCRNGNKLIPSLKIRQALVNNCGRILAEINRILPNYQNEVDLLLRSKLENSEMSFLDDQNFSIKRIFLNSSIQYLSGFNKSIEFINRICYSYMNSEIHLPNLPVSHLQASAGGPNHGSHQTKTPHNSLTTSNTEAINKSIKLHSTAQQQLLKSLVHFTKTTWFELYFAFLLTALESQYENIIMQALQTSLHLFENKKLLEISNYLYNKSFYEMVEKSLFLLSHPNMSINRLVAKLIYVCSLNTGSMQFRIFIKPVLLKLLKGSPSELTVGNKSRSNTFRVNKMVDSLDLSSGDMGNSLLSDNVFGSYSQHPGLELDRESTLQSFGNMSTNLALISVLNQEQILLYLKEPLHHQIYEKVLDRYKSYCQQTLYTNIFTESGEGSHSHKNVVEDVEYLRNFLNNDVEMDNYVGKIGKEIYRNLEDLNSFSKPEQSNFKRDRDLGFKVVSLGFEGTFLLFLVGLWTSRIPKDYKINS